MANYIYGLPGDTKDTINETFKLSKTKYAVEPYAAMALPERVVQEALEKL